MTIHWTPNKLLIKSIIHLLYRFLQIDESRWLIPTAFQNSSMIRRLKISRFQEELIPSIEESHC